MTRYLSIALVLGLFSSCFIHVEANGDPDLASALHAWQDPAFRSLVDDLDDAGWQIEDMRRRGSKSWSLELESMDHDQEATMRVELGPGRDYTIRKLKFDADGDSGQRERDALRALANPEPVKAEPVEVIELDAV